MSDKLPLRVMKKRSVKVTTICISTKLCKPTAALLHAGGTVFIPIADIDHHFWRTCILTDSTQTHTCMAGVHD